MNTPINTPIKAAICRQFKTPLTIEEAILAPVSSGQVRIKIKACAICHSDIAFIDGMFGGHLPAVYGHEAAGVVMETGGGVAGFATNDRVIVTLIRSCGQCCPCTQGQPTACSTDYDRLADSPLKTKSGEKLEHGMAVSAFAEEVIVDQSQIHLIPDALPMEVAALLSCGVITGFGAVVNSAKMRSGASVVVIGAGGVGLNTIQGARIAGARQIIAVDVARDKLDCATDFGATDTVLAGKDLTDKIHAMTQGGADYVFVTTGAIAVFDTAPDLLARGGEMVMVGMPPIGAKANYEPINIVFSSQVLRGSRMGETVLKRDIPMLLSLYDQGRLKLDELITNRYGFAQINEAIADTRIGKCQRNVVIFD